MKKNVFHRILAVLCAVLCLIPLCTAVAFAAAESTEAASGINIDFGRALEKLVWMAEGMICIIAVMLLLIVITMILNKVTASKKK